MRKQYFFGALVLAILCCTTATATTIEAGSNTAIARALLRLSPGDTLLLTDGSYRNIQLVVFPSGSSDHPITIAARNPGRVVFCGDARVELRGHHLVLSGIYFTNGQRNPAQWHTHGPGLVVIYGSYDRVTKCAFNNFDEVSSAYITTSLDASGNVPQHCRIDHCSFTNKLTLDQVINLNNTAGADKTSGRGGPPMYHRVDHCFFSNPKKKGNAGGAIRIGYYRNDTGRCLIDSNIFMRQDSEPEIITSKSRENVFYDNSFINCQGTLNFRHGDKQVALRNVFTGTDTLYGYGGMFVWGSDHVIAGNYFNLPRTITSRGNAALYLNPGSRASEHALAFHILVLNNWFVNINCYAVHMNPLDSIRRTMVALQHQAYEVPSDIFFAGNLFYTSQLRPFSFFKDNYLYIDRKNHWIRNNYQGAASGLAPFSGLTAKKIPAVVQQGSCIFPDYHPYFFDFSGAFYTSIEGIPLQFQTLALAPACPRTLSVGDLLPKWMLRTLGSYYQTGKLTPELAARLKRIER